jgi:hypothetical protein
VDTLLLHRLLEPPVEAFDAHFLSPLRLNGVSSLSIWEITLTTSFFVPSSSRLLLSRSRKLRKCENITHLSRDTTLCEDTLRKIELCSGSLPESSCLHEGWLELVLSLIIMMDITRRDLHYILIIIRSMNVIYAYSTVRGVGFEPTNP